MPEPVDCGRSLSTTERYLLKAIGSNSNSRLQLIANTKGAIWIDQVSVMPRDTHKELVIEKVQPIDFHYQHVVTAYSLTKAWNIIICQILRTSNSNRTQTID